MGYAGQISLGHAGFFAIGGYTAAFLTTGTCARTPAGPAVRLLGRSACSSSGRTCTAQPSLHLSPWLALAMALAVAAAAALLIGLPVIRLRGHYLAMATLGFGIIIYRVVLGTPALGEADGFSDVPPFRLFGSLEVNGRRPFAVQNYYIAWALGGDGHDPGREPGAVARRPRAARDPRERGSGATRWASTSRATSWRCSS